MNTATNPPAAASRGPSPAPHVNSASEAATTRTRPQSVEITLDEPIKVGGVDTTKLVMRRPKVRDRIAAGREPISDTEKEALLLGNLCGLAPSEMDDMDLPDYQKLQEAYSGFLSGK